LLSFTEYGTSFRSHDYIDIGDLYVQLYNGQNYSVQLRADVTGEGYGGAGASSDFEWSDRTVAWNYLQVGDV